MVPAQILTDLEQEKKSEIGVKGMVVQDGTSLKCMSNCEDTAFDMELILDQKPIVRPGVTDSVNVDIVECMGASEIRLAEGDDPNATEYSSSFGDTVSGAEDGSRLSDAEVESQFCGDNGLDSNFFDGFDSLFRMRKKKLTAHWRRYIRPLMWRCKWIELRIKEFQSQSIKYDRELAAYDQRKQLEFGQFASEACGVRTLPFPRQSHRKKAMKRRKRKRIEDTDDITSYMSYHNLFSYYENKKSDADGVSMDEDCGRQVTAADINRNDEFGVNYEWPSLEFRDEDNFLEQIIWKIETVQTRVQKLKTQIDELLTQNAGKFSSMENLSLLVPSDLPMSSARSPTLSPGNGDNIPIGAKYTPPRNMSEYDIGDMVMPESVVSSYGEANPLPDIIESTIGLLSAPEASLDQPQTGDSCKNIVEDDVLIHNEAVDRELHDFGKLRIPTIEKPQEPLKEQEKVLSNPPLVPASEPDTTPETVPAQEQSVLKFCLNSNFHVPKNKRKRAERKAGSGSWNAEKFSTQILK